MSSCALLLALRDQQVRLFPGQRPLTAAHQSREVVPDSFCSWGSLTIITEVWVSKAWSGSERATPRYNTLAYWLSGDVSPGESAHTGRTGWPPFLELKAGHRIFHEKGPPSTRNSSIFLLMPEWNRVTTPTKRALILHEISPSLSHRRLPQPQPLFPVTSPQQAVLCAKVMQLWGQLASSDFHFSSEDSPYGSVILQPQNLRGQKEVFPPLQVYLANTRHWVKAPSEEDFSLAHSWHCF